jgi:hypothetical protein
VNDPIAAELRAGAVPATEPGPDPAAKPSHERPRLGKMSKAMRVIAKILGKMSPGEQRRMVRCLSMLYEGDKS